MLTPYFSYFSGLNLNLSMIQYELIEGVGKITLNRPDKYHSFVREMALQLQDVLDKCKEDKAVRAILITATGKAFCAGQDLGEATDPNGPVLTQIVQEHYNPLIRKIRNIEKPIVAAVNGVAAGAGASIALACDVVVATENASFIQAFSKIGLIPDGSRRSSRCRCWARSSASWRSRFRWCSRARSRTSSWIWLTPNSTATGVTTRQSRGPTRWLIRFIY